MRSLKKKLNSGQVLLLNLVISAALVLYFVISTLSLTGGLYQERLNQVQRVAGHFSVAFEEEITALDNMMYLCQKDPVFISAVNSPKTEWNDLSRYVSQSISQLSIMGHGFYAVDAFYLYAPSMDKLIGAGGYVNADLFLQMNWLKERLMPDEQVPELAEMQEGWYLYRNFSLYTSHVSNGLLIAVINPRYMVDLENFNDLYPGQHMVVINKEGQYLASSLDSDEAHGADWGALEDGELVELHGEDYEIHCVEGKVFTYLLLTDIKTLEQEYRRNNIMALVLALGMMGLLTVLLFTNHTFIDGIRSALGRRWSAQTVESVQITQAMLENDEWRRRELKSLFADAAKSGTLPRLSSRQIELIESRFEHYSVAALAMQTPEGDPAPDLMKDLITFMEDSMICCSVQSGSARIDLIFEAGQSVKRCVEGFVAGQNAQIMAYVGTSTICHKAQALETAIRQAQRRMLKVRVGAEAVCAQWYETTGNENSMTEEEVCRLRTVCDSGGEEDIYRYFHMLLSGENISLSDMQSIGYGALCIMGASDPKLANRCYHPEYLCRQLTEAAISIRKPIYVEEISEAQEIMRRNVLAYLDSHCAEEVTLDSLADHFHVTAMHMSRWFKKMNGVNFSTYLSAMRMKRAQELLLDLKGYKVAEVAVMVGIQNTHTFTRQFKNYTGMTPDQYRHQGVASTE